MNPLCAADRTSGLDPLTQTVASFLFGLPGNILLIVLFVGVFLWWRKHCSDVRKKWAASHGLRFVKTDKALGKRTSGVYGLPGMRHIGRDVIVVPAAAGSALYYEVTWDEWCGYNDMKMDQRCSFLRYPLPGFFPRMHIKPEGVFGLANNDVNTEWQAFNKEFDVKSEDERAAHALLTGPMQEFLMARMRGLHIEFSGNEAFIVLGNYKPENSVAYAGLMNEWLSMVPRYFFSAAPTR